MPYQFVHPFLLPFHWIPENFVCKIQIMNNEEIDYRQTQMLYIIYSILANVSTQWSSSGR